MKLDNLLSLRENMEDLLTILSKYPDRRILDWIFDDVRVSLIRFTDIFPVSDISDLSKMLTYNRQIIEKYGGRTYQASLRIDTTENFVSSSIKVNPPMRILPETYVSLVDNSKHTCRIAFCVAMTTLEFIVMNEIQKEQV